MRSEVSEAETSQAGADRWCADGVETWPDDDECEHGGMGEDLFEKEQPEPDDAGCDDYGDDDMMVNETRSRRATPTDHIWREHIT